MTPGATPRAPLAVRRTAPVARPRARARRDDTPAEPWLALDTADLPIGAGHRCRDAPVPAPAAAEIRAPSRRAGARISRRRRSTCCSSAASTSPVVYFTLRICDLTFAEVLTLPLAPLSGFSSC